MREQIKVAKRSIPMVILKDDEAESNSDSETETEHTSTNEIPQSDEQDDAEMEEGENLAPLPTVPMQALARRVPVPCSHT